MKPFSTLIGIALVGFALAPTAFAADLDKLKVLYIGDTETPRAKQFEGFLRQNVAHIDVASRRDFKPAEAAKVDVVVLDWPQSDTAREERRSGTSPLGERTAWNKPTVLLGSAGLNLAAAWKVRGGSG